MTFRFAATLIFNWVDSPPTLASFLFVSKLVHNSFSTFPQPQSGCIPAGVLQTHQPYFIPIFFPLSTLITSMGWNLDWKQSTMVWMRIGTTMGIAWVTFKKSLVTICISTGKFKDHVKTNNHHHQSKRQQSCGCQ